MIPVYASDADVSEHSIHYQCFGCKVILEPDKWNYEFNNSEGLLFWKFGESSQLMSSTTVIVATSHNLPGTLLSKIRA